jgi:anaerobic magnesium-protoporphyrin IX monomethyl ester cyclase
MDLVLVSPASRKQLYQDLGHSLAAIEPPVWAALMAEFVRRAGFSVEILDAEALGLSHEQVAVRVDEIDPRLAAVVVYGHQPSASTQNMPAAGAVCAALKQKTPTRPVLLVGGHVAALPERTLAEEQADFVCSGEGPYTLTALLQALGSKEPRLDLVPDLWYREGREPRFTRPAPLVKDLDQEMPGLAWDLLPMDRYRAHNWHAFGHLQRAPYAALYTTLGCPYRCTFCCIQAPFKSGEGAMGYAGTVNTYRMWSPARVADALETLATRYGVKNVKIADEMFVLNPAHVRGVCQAIVDRGLDLNIWAYARVDTVRDDMIELLRRAGVRWLAFGIEAASERVRAEVDKGFGQDLIFETVGKVRKAGIHVIGNYIFGLPEDDQASMQATLEMALELNCEFANFYSTMAYPGSPLYRQAIDQGWTLPASWSGYSQHAVDTLPLPTRHLSAGEVLRFRDRAFKEYFESPRYLEMVDRTFGAETVAHIRQMMTHKLVRRHA